MKKLLFTASLALTLPSVALADQYLIDEMESLKATLDKTDPDRAELSLRLADLYFDVSIQEGKHENILSQRQAALKLYTDVLYGKDNIPKASGKKANTIKFQIARVLAKLNRHDDGQKYYHEVFVSELSSKKLKREAAFSLAEYYEEKANFNKADGFYKKALSLCDSLESKNYAHYKRAWLHYKEVKLDTAIEELKLSLFEKDGSVREKVINDLLLFFSAQTTNGEPELAYIRELMVKTGQKDLVRRLVESFYGAGNRIAGSVVLVQLNNDKPDPFYEMRLLEEFYGFRDIDLVKDYLTRIQKRNISEVPKEKEESKEFKAMLKRVIVQFDSEVESNPNYIDILKGSIDQYLVFYPNDDMRKKMQQGWLKVEKSLELKIERLGVWIDQDIAYSFDPSEIRKLRQTRLSLGQKVKNQKVVLHESLEIAKILKGSEQAREFQYVAAREYFKANKLVKALELFLPLAELKNRTSIDNWALLSQNLILDIYNTKKDYKAILNQVDMWLSNELAVGDKKRGKDIKEMALIRKQASFEAVTSLGKTKEALDKFYSFCFNKVYEKKSCSNAKILAVNLKDQEKLVKLLEKSKDEKSLITEYELMGRFSDAARLQEKYNLVRNSGIIDYLKIAVLFEIDENFKDRDRILKKMISKIRRDKKIEKQFEVAIYKTLDEANLLNNRTLMLPWSLERKISLANRLSIQKPSKVNKKLISLQKEYAGSTWAKMVLNKVQKSFKKQAKVKFYGRRSKTLFKRRVKSIEKLEKVAKSYLNGSDVKTRIYILNMVKLAYENFSTEIMNTPLPDGLTEEILLQVQANLTQMSEPYINVAGDYERLQNDELSKLPSEEKSDYFVELNDENIDYVSLIKDDKFEVHHSADLDFNLIRGEKVKLLTNPSDLEALVKIENHFKENNNARIAAYFTGRINSLKEVK